jgi:hypothetical protein
MRSLTPAALALTLALTLPVPAPAQKPPKVSIDDNGVRVGFRSLRGDGSGSGSKTGFWAPVYVQITAGLDRVGPADGWITVGTTDSDDMENVYRVPLPPMEAKEQRTVLAYVRTGATGSDINVKIRDSRGQTLSAQQNSRSGYDAIAPGAFLYVTAGGGAAGSALGLHVALHPKKNDNAQQVVDDTDQLLGVAYIGQARDLPTQWFGYQAADVLVLETGSKTFTQDLLDDQYNRKEALAEWVRRGGRLVISVGHEHQLARALLEKLQLLPCTLNGTVQRPALTGIGRWIAGGAGAGAPERLVGKPPKGKPGAKAQDIDLVKIEVPQDRGVQVLAEEVGDRGEHWPVIVQAQAGLGRVMLVGIDLDREPFTEWKGQGAFWRQLDTEFRGSNPQQGNNPAFNPAGFGGPGMPMAPGMPGWDPNHNDVTALMVDRLESFTEVPVISFGWVALFILVYIIVVGPLDYFFLKKVVKRLELTWITFPAVVIAVSAIAYVSAYYLKGNDLRINKVDLIDVVAERPGPDAADAPVARGARAYGHTWFTVFSPRIQNYTIGLEPSTGTWVPDPGNQPAGANPHGVVVSWLGRPENVFGGTGRAGSTSLFRRPYDYAPEAAGLRGVPIQVWSTKSFGASWQAALSEDRPLVRANLTRSKGQAGTDVLTGSITSELPAELENVEVFYQNTYFNKSYLKLPQGKLEPGATLKLDLAVNAGGAHGTRLEDWFANVSIPTNTNNPWQQRNRVNVMQSAEGIMKDLMFGAKDTASNHAHNATLRPLDESWLLKNPDVAVVVGTLKRQEAANAEEVSQNAASPSRIWMDRLPIDGQPRLPLAGKMTQEAYVRIFVPVTPK